MSSKGISLVAGQVVRLEINGALVYVESVTTKAAELIVLPQQGDTFDADDRFVPGRVGVIKVSPFATGEEVPIVDLSDRNRSFIGSYEQLREQHGPKFIDQTEEEATAMAVKKSAGTKPTKTPKAPKPEKAKKEPKPKKEKKAKTAKSDFKYKVFTSKTLAAAEKFNAKFKPGNRGHKVWEAVKELGGTASVGEVVAHLNGKDPEWCAEPEKVVARALKQLATDECGRVTELVID